MKSNAVLNHFSTLYESYISIKFWLMLLIIRQIRVIVANTSRYLWAHQNCSRHFFGFLSCMPLLRYQHSVRAERYDIFQRHCGLRRHLVRQWTDGTRQPTQQCLWPHWLADRRLRCLQSQSPHLARL